MLIHEYSIFLPLMFVVYWAMTEGRKNPPTVDTLVWWVICVVTEIASSKLIESEEAVELRGPIPFFLYLGAAIFFGKKISALTAFSLVWISILIADIFFTVKRGIDYHGIGGAGIGDALFLMPCAAAIVVHYVEWRKSYT